MGNTYKLICFLAIVSIVLVILDVMGFFGTNSCSCSKNNEGKESFVASPNGAYRTSTNSYSGHNLMTNGMMNGSVDQLHSVYDKTGHIYDDEVSLGATPGNGFDKPYENQTAIQDLTAGNDGTNFQSYETLDAISRKIGSNQNNANNNLYTRAGAKPTKLVIEPNGIRGVIDAKYLPDRDKNYQIATVSTVVPVQGYDVNVERLGENLIDTHFSQISHNGKRNRIPTAAGAVGGGARVNNKIEGEMTIDNDNSATSEAVKNNITVAGDKLLIKDDNGGNVGVNLEETPAETFKSKYVRGNHQ